jgi:hypothetical protein
MADLGHDACSRSRTGDQTGSETTEGNQMHLQIVTRAINSPRTFIEHHRGPARGGVARVGRNHPRRRRPALFSVAVIATAFATLGSLVAVGSPGYAGTPQPAPGASRPGGAPARKPVGTATVAENATVVAWQNQATVRCLDASQVGLRTFGCNHASFINGFQAWEEIFAGQLYNDATGQCLDDSNDFGLRVFGCNYDSWFNGYQDWLELSDGELQNGATGRCLDDSNDVGLRTFDCNDASIRHGYQKWSQITP